jgi:hypothetical protein
VATAVWGNKDGSGALFEQIALALHGHPSRLDILIKRN